MATFFLQGMGVALITPFKADKTIDFDALERLLNLHINAKSDFLVILGTTAETATLSLEEQHEIVRFTVSYVQDRLPIVVGMGGNNTAALAQRIKSFDFNGVHSILSVTPYYTKPTQEGLFQHYVAISQASSLPIVLYNVPSRTGVNIEAATALRLARHCKNIIGIKEAHHDMKQVKELVEGAPKGFSVLSGDDPMTVPLIEAGGQGVISVLGNAFPKEFGAIVRKALKGEIEHAKEGFQQLAACCDLFFVEGNPAGVKCALNLMGYVHNELRLPLVAVSKTTEAAMNIALNKCIS